MECVLDFDRPNPNLSTVNEHHFEVVDCVSIATCGGLPTCKIIAKVNSPGRRSDFQIEVVDKLVRGKGRATFVRPCEHRFETAIGLCDVERVAFRIPRT